MIGHPIENDTSVFAEMLNNEDIGKLSMDIINTISMIVPKKYSVLLVGIK
jgi:phage-related protein